MGEFCVVALFLLFAFGCLLAVLEAKPAPAGPRPLQPTAQRASRVDWGAMLAGAYGYRQDSEDRDAEVVPSGYTRGEYKEWGATDDDIEDWGLDQPMAHPPESAGWVIWDMVDDMGW